MRFPLITIVLVASLCCISSAPPCLEGINLLPKYGHTQKCAAQLEADARFIAEVEQRYGSRQAGSQTYVETGWELLKRNQAATAMRRFNQAWLLDSLNKELEWGFGSALGRIGKNQEALQFFKVATVQHASNSRVWLSAATNYGDIWAETRKIAYLDTAVTYLRKSITLNTTEAYAYAELAKVYHFYPQPDSAKKYLAIAESINPTQVDWRIREVVNK